VSHVDRKRTFIKWSALLVSQTKHRLPNFNDMIKYNGEKEVAASTELQILNNMKEHHTPNKNA